MKGSFNKKLIIVIKKIIDAVLLILGIITIENMHNVGFKSIYIILFMIFEVVLLVLNHYIFYKKILKI